jgi:hypothetical protein
MLVFTIRLAKWLLFSGMALACLVVGGRYWYWTIDVPTVPELDGYWIAASGNCRKPELGIGITASEDRIPNKLVSLNTARNGLGFFVQSASKVLPSRVYAEWPGIAPWQGKLVFDVLDDQHVMLSNILIGNSRNRLMTIGELDVFLPFEARFLKVGLILTRCP